MRIRLAAALVALLVICTQVQAANGTIRELTIQSAAIAGNRTGTPAEQQLAVYLPPGYETGTQRYPVLYLLHGIVGTYKDFTEWLKIAPAMDALIAAGTRPFIVVMPNGGNVYGGAFYSNSPVVGNWETYITSELVAKIDREFRTHARASSRGIAGHSMGGFGAINLGMKHPDVFGSVYAISPCCLAMSEDIGYGNPEWRKAVAVKSQEDIAALLKVGDFYPMAMIGLAAVLSPNLEKPPFFVDLPVKHVRGELMPDEAVFESWRRQFPIERVDDLRDNLMSLRAIGMDYGTSDQFAHIPTATADFSHELSRLRVPHTLDVYRGDHRQQVGARLGTIVLPFFARNLEY
jgi:S-formylglutathione hydrolase FrmB